MKWHSKKWTSFFFFDHRISLAYVTISDEEGDIDILARSGTWPGGRLCSAYFLRRRRAQLSKQNWKSWRRKEDYMRSALKCAQSQDRAHLFRNNGIRGRLRVSSVGSWSL